jgi:hypothetical protein
MRSAGSTNEGFYWPNSSPETVACWNVLRHTPTSHCSNNEPRAKCRSLNSVARPSNYRCRSACKITGDESIVWVANGHSP